MKKILVSCASCALLAAACNNSPVNEQLQQAQLQQACAAQSDAAAHSFMTTLPSTSNITGHAFHYSQKLSTCLVEVKAQNGPTVFIDALLDANTATHPLINCDRHFEDPQQPFKVTEEECTGPDAPSANSLYPDSGWWTISNDMSN